MPSDPRTTQALSALAQPIAEFRALVEAALAQADAFLAARGATSDVAAAGARSELGVFADGRMDAAAFAALFPKARRVDDAAVAALERAADVLRAVAARGDDLFIADVPPGGRLASMVDAALSAAGRAFGAVMLTELVRGGRYVAAEHDRLLDAVEFHRWTKTERRFAPPLVVEVDGADVHAGALIDFADGREKLVLVVRGPTRARAAGALHHAGHLRAADHRRLRARPGSRRTTARRSPHSCPRARPTFMHDPLGGREPWQRLTVQHLPEPPKRGVRGLSAFQMGEDLKLLADLARTPFAVPAAAGGGRARGRARTPSTGSRRGSSRESGLQGQGLT